MKQLNQNHPSPESLVDTRRVSDTRGENGNTEQPRRPAADL